MRIFSGDSKDIAEVKYWLFRHKQVMKAGDLDFFRTVGSLFDGRRIVITSSGEIDNIIVSRFPEKKRLEDFVMPKMLRGGTVIWTGLCDQKYRFPLYLYEPLAKILGASIIDSPRLPSFGNLLFVMSPSVEISDEDASAIAAKVATGSKVVVHAGITGDSDVFQWYDNWGMSEEDSDVITGVNTVLWKIGSPLRMAPAWEILTIYSYTSHPSRTRYTSGELPKSYDGIHSFFKFNSLEKPFIVNGGAFSVNVWDIEKPEIISKSVRTWSQQFPSSPPVTGEHLPILCNVGNSVIARLGLQFPITESYQAAIGSGITTWWEIVPEETFNFFLLAGTGNPAWGDFSWDTEHLMGYHNNVMLSATGDKWFSDSRIYSKEYANFEFVVSLALEQWNPPLQDYKVQMPILYNYYDSSNVPFLKGV